MVALASRQAARVKGRQESAVDFGAALRRSERVDDGAVLVDSVDRRLHKPDDPAVADVLLEAIPGVGGPSASSSSFSLADETSLEGSPPHPPHPTEGIGVPPVSIAANASESRTPEDAREGVQGD